MIDLQAVLENSTCSAHESIKLRCSLINQNGKPLDLPSPYDRSGAFRVLLHGEQLELLRRMDRRTRQRMLVDGRVDSALTLDTLQAGARWDWRLDLASFHFPSCPGSYFVDAELEYPAEGLRANSGLLAVSVAQDPLVELSAMRDNPAIEGLTLLFNAQTEQGRSYFLRQYNYDRPEGAWYSARVLQGEHPDTVFMATAGFFQTESVDPAYRRWLIWTADGFVYARPHDDGMPATQGTRRARIPGGATIVQSAFWTLEDEVLLFFWSIGGYLECWRLSKTGFAKAFEYKPPVAVGAPISIGADQTSIHIAMAWRGILYDRLDYRGRREERIHAFRSRLRCRMMEYDPAGHRIKALFQERSDGGVITMVAVNFRKDSVNAYSIDRLNLRDPVEEMSVDQDQRGRFHLLVSTQRGRLYYFSEERGPVLVAEGESRYFPVVCAPLKVYLGLYRRDFGYRFVQYQRRRQGRKIVGLEAHPHVDA